ncbi:MAG: hypothetical protein ACOC1K_02050, partial [Nanoarchaeota archaeon]
TDLLISIEKAYLRDPSNDIWLDSLAYSIYPQEVSLNDQNRRTGKWILESSLGTINSFTWGMFTLNAIDGSSQLIYSFDDNYKVPLLTFKHFKWTDSSGDTQNFGDKTFILEIEDGKISMNKQVFDDIDPSLFLREERHFINFNYDTSLDEQMITLNVVYDSGRFPIYSYDASILYDSLNNSSSVYTQKDSLVVDNSIYNMPVNHIGDYTVELFGFDGMNNIFSNEIREPYNVWTKYPKICLYTDSSSLGNVKSKKIINPTDISTLLYNNRIPLFDKIVPLQGLRFEYDPSGNPYIEIPSISYFIDLPEEGSLTRFYNLTERITSINGNNFYYDKDYQDFKSGDDISLVKFSKNTYDILVEASSYINSATSSYLTLDNVPTGFNSIDSSIEMFLINTTLRNVDNISLDSINRLMTCDICTYKFRENQLVSFIIDNSVDGYSWAGAHRVISSSDNGTHVFEGNIPNVVLERPDIYNIRAKHAFTTYASYQINVDDSFEIGNNFNLYMDDPYYHQYYLDSTFVYVNILFDQERVMDQWYDPSDNLFTGQDFYKYCQSVTVDISTLVIIKSEFDPSTYMLDQKNIWTIRKGTTGEYIMKVYNDSVAYIFNETGIYDVQVESYDAYGNIRKQIFEGLINVE